MFTSEELRQAKIFARLTQTVADVRLKPGEWPFREGSPPSFYVLLEGHLRIVLPLESSLPSLLSILRAVVRANAEVCVVLQRDADKIRYRILRSFLQGFSRICGWLLIGGRRGWFASTGRLTLLSKRRVAGQARQQRQSA